MVLQRIADMFLGVAGAILESRDPDPVSQSIRDWIAQQEDDLHKGYSHYQRYYRGEQKVRLIRRLRRFLPDDLEFRDNFCEVVVDALAERLQVVSFASPNNEVFAQWVQELWAANRMDMEQIIVHGEAILKGDSYVMVDYDAEAGRPRLMFQPPDTITPRYDPTTRKMAFAAKKWQVVAEAGAGPVTRMNIYYPDRVEKYILASRVWRPWTDEGDSDWPLPWVDSQGAPLGIPIVHFRNRPMGDDFGVSELHNITPIQDLLNKTLVDLVMILDTLGFPQRWAIGIEAPGTPFKTVPGQLWNIKSGDPASAKVGQFEAALVDGPLKSIETFIQHIAGISRTPQHLFHLGGEYPSGEALKVAEAGLVHKAKLRQVGFGNSWEDAIMLAAKLEGVFGSRRFENVSVETVWANRETKNEEAFIASLATKRTSLGVPEVQIWREAGYNQEQITQMLQEKQDEKVAASNIGAELLRQFEQGIPGET